MNLALSRRAFAAAAAAVPMACTNAGGVAMPGRPTSGNRSSLSMTRNPLVKNRADAQIFRHEDGMYYMTGSVPEYDRLVLRRASTIAGLADAEERVLWRHAESGPLSGFIWAPEMHQIDGRWYFYFAAGPSGGGEDVFRIRTYVAQCDSADPMSGNWTIAGEFKTPWDSFNLDSTIFQHRGTRYFVWAQREPGIETNSNMYIAPLATPLTLAAPAARLTVPTLDWEIRGFKVNEAAAVLERNGRLFMTYSASATDDRYCLGLLTADADANIMDPRAWTKSSDPVFVTNVSTSVYGPGHNSFTTDEAGNDVLVYHGRDYREIEGDPLFNPDRHTRVQKLYYKPDGSPDFGVPVGNGPLPERFSPVGRPQVFLAHQAERPLVAGGPLAQTQYRAIAEADGNVSLSPILLRDHRLVAGGDGSVRLLPMSEIGGNGRGAQFRRIENATDGTVTFAIPGMPGKALGFVDGKLALASSRGPQSQWTVS
ncbi:family 43 glycosylhydrolase [Croceicoccus hydrothermalis]|uniref:glycoside hydrolase family 43 protein n=1 Tax=Croceicoccus hydrothermalis TaxID=2867964 RepID=UPI001EFBDB6E|nr:glycoside hydrolase family 43 protein [Croceicoccus hydrothermalis]